MIGEQLLVHVCVVAAGHAATLLLLSSRINVKYNAVIALIQTVATFLAAGVYIAAMRVVKKVWKLNILVPLMVTVSALYVSMMIDNAVRMHIGYNNKNNDTQAFHTFSAMTTGLFLIFLMR
jgi:hypothetical protein